MKQQHIEKALYDLALTIAGEPEIARLTRQFLQRLLYHTGFTAGVLLHRSLQAEAPILLVQVLGGGGKSALVGKILDWPASLMQGANAFLPISALPEDDLTRSFEKVKHVLSLAAGPELRILLFTRELYDGAEYLPDVFQPVLLRFAQAYNLITKSELQKQELIKTKEAAEVATEAKSIFLAKMSHELRTPLNAILGMLYLALRNELPPSLSNHLRKAQSAANSLLNIINDLLDLSKIEAGKMEIEHIEFGIDGVLEKLVSIVSPLASDKNIEFLIRYDMTTPPILVGDPQRLGQVLLNLCSNAVKFTERGQVELILHAQDENSAQLLIQICVRDSGIGMNAEQQARMFQNFTQADSSMTRRYGGTGLGLAISRHMLELMGGRIWIEQSQPGQGTTICLSVPLGLPSEEMHTSPKKLLQQVGNLLQGIRILVVDDNEVSRDILYEMLINFRIEVDTAPSGPAALAAMEKNSANGYDLVLMDWMMPGMNGVETLRRMQQDISIIRKPKAIIVTAYGQEEVISQAEGVGVEAFLVKPVSPSTLLDTILMALGRGHLPGTSTAQEQSRQHREHSKFTGLQLLLVEDNEINREFASVLLSDMGFEVDEAVHGEMAVEKISSKNYDIVMMDIQMPVMSGLEATRHIRALAESTANSYFSDLPIIAMTAQAMERDLQDSLAAGMNDHVTKPVDPKHLRATLTKWLRVSPQAQNDEVDDAMQIPHDLQTLSNINARDGIHRIGDKPDAYRRQLKRFRQHFGNAVDQLQILLAAGEIENAEHYCHSLKGVVGNIGAEALFTIVANINTSLHLGQPPQAHTMQELARQLQLVLADIDSLGDNANSNTAQDKHSRPDAEQLSMQLTQLAHALKYDLGQVEAILERLQSGMTDMQWERELECIAQSIDVFNIDAAQTQIDQLMTRLNNTTCT